MLLRLRLLGGAANGEHAPGQRPRRYLSLVNGREIYCFEDRCEGKGDASCHLVGRVKQEWDGAGDPEVAAQLEYYQRECLDGALEGLGEALRAAERRLRARRQALARLAPGAEERGGLVVKSEAMHRVLELATRVAKVESTALITGESGVGKEKIARLIHDASPRAGGPFVGVNCGAVTETLLESVLFGHVRGAFTGADRERAGLFEAAHGGTLFLDEGEVSPAAQALGIGLATLKRKLQQYEVAG